MARLWAWALGLTAAVVGCSDTGGAARPSSAASATGGVGGATGAVIAPGSGGVLQTGGAGTGGARFFASGGSGGAMNGMGGSLQVSGGSGGAASPSAGGVASSGGRTSGGGSGGGPGSTACAQGPGKALKFDGNAEDLLTADLGADLPIARTSRTVELWAYFEDMSWSQEHSLWEYGSGDCHVFGLDTDDVGNLNPYGQGCGSDNTVALMPAAPKVGWLHLAWAYDGPNNKFQFTVNGVEQTLPSPSPDAGWTTSNSPLTIGAPSDGTPGFAGTLDELRVWNVFRSPADIARDMRVFLHGNEPGLVAYYHFDEGQGTMTADVSPGAHHASMISTLKPEWVDSTIPGTFSCAP